MTGFLLDVNVLIALMWPAHQPHLLGLAIHKKGKLATLDQAVLALLPPDSPHRQRVEII
jgi:hypothetical protein